MTDLPTRRTVVIASASAAASLALPWSARAQSYPEKGRPIRAVLPSSPGSATDGMARAYGQAMGEILGTNVIVENRAGGEGVIGAMAVKSSAPDGYTTLFTSLSAMVVNPHTFKQLSYDPMKDFIPLSGTVQNTLVLAVGPSVPFKTAKEFLAAAKANPGKYTYASVSAITRLAGSMLMKAAGVELLNVPYKSMGDLGANWLGGSVDAFIADLATFNPFLTKGVRPLAVAGKSHLAAIPNVPTFQEEGVSGIELTGWFAAYAPAGTPALAVAKLRDAMRQASQSKVVKDYLSNFNAEPFDLVGDDLAAFQRVEFDKWGKAVRDAGMTGTL
jgi:tripartite-type tricarboxylate transporter receptor subunit TctC